MQSPLGWTGIDGAIWEDYGLIRWVANASDDYSPYALRIGQSAEFSFKTTGVGVGYNGFNIYDVGYAFGGGASTLQAVPEPTWLQLNAQVAAAANAIDALEAYREGILENETYLWALSETSGMTGDGSEVGSGVLEDDYDSLTFGVSMPTQIQLEQLKLQRSSVRESILGQIKKIQAAAFSQQLFETAAKTCQAEYLIQAGLPLKPTAILELANMLKYKNLAVGESAKVLSGMDELGRLDNLLKAMDIKIMQWEYLLS
jgi:hypothetical protein